MRKLLFVCAAILVTTQVYAQGLTANSVAQWKKVASFGALVRSVFFLDDVGHPEIGFVGLGLDDGTGQVWRTTDAGATWRMAAPNALNATVSAFSFKDSLTGWLGTFTLQSAYGGCYKTTDGGATWNLVLKNDYCGSVKYNRATDRVFVGTWAGGAFASTDEGATWSQIGTANFNGIAFSGDSNGIMSVLQGRYQTTTDGGVTWSMDTMTMECWQPTATRDGVFYAVDEVRGEIARSDDAGRSWTQVGQLPIFFVTGDIEGACGRLIVQTNSPGNGFYQSTDEGQTWQPIGGVSNILDTRFFYAGTRIYAGDTAGELWEATLAVGDTVERTVSLRAPNGALQESVHAGEDVDQEITLRQTSPSVLPHDTVTVSLSYPEYMLTLESITPGTAWDTVQVMRGTSTITLMLRATNHSATHETSEPLATLHFHSALGVMDTGVVRVSAADFGPETVPPCTTTAQPLDENKAVAIAVIRDCGHTVLQNMLNGRRLFELIGVAPDPASTRAEIFVNAAEPVVVDVTLVAMTGESVRHWTRAMENVGESTLPIDLTGIPEGRYILTLKAHARAMLRGDQHLGQLAAQQYSRAIVVLHSR